jgi:hypothetical protein
MKRAARFMVTQPRPVGPDQAEDIYVKSVCVRHYTTAKDPTLERRRLRSTRVSIPIAQRSDHAQGLSPASPASELSQILHQN